MKVWNVIVGFILLLASTAVLAPARAEAQGLTLGDYAASLEMPLSAISAPLTELQMDAVQPVPQALYLSQARLDASPVDWASSLGRLGFLSLLDVPSVASAMETLRAVAPVLG